MYTNIKIKEKSLLNPYIGLKFRVLLLLLSSSCLNTELNTNFSQVQEIKYHAFKFLLTQMPFFGIF